MTTQHGAIRGKTQNKKVETEKSIILRLCYKWKNILEKKD